MISATTFADASNEKKIKLFPAVFGGMIPDDPITKVPGGRVWMRFAGQDPKAYHLSVSASGSLPAFVDSAAALVCWPMQSKAEVASALPLGVRKTLSMSQGLGRIFSDKTVNPVQTGMKFLEENDRKTFHIFEGTIESVSEDQSRVELTNGKDSMIILSAGENLVAIKNGEAKAMAPDSICYVTQEGTALSSAEVNELKEKRGNSVTVHVVAVAAREEIRKSDLVEQVFGILRGNSLSQAKKLEGVGLAASAVREIGVGKFSPIEALNASSNVVVAG
jgi:hypothetical protein